MSVTSKASARNRPVRARGPSQKAQTTTLARTIEALAETHDLAAVTSIVTRAARRLIDADGVSFVLREEDDRCHYADEDAISPLWKGQRFPMDACISGWVMRHGRAVVIPDISVDARIPQDAYRPTFVRSLSMVPVRTPEPVAAIGAYWARPHTTSAGELNLLHRLAGSAALALQNIALREAIRRRDAFIATLAHELRQPLHAATGALGLLAIQGQLGGASRACDVLARQLRHLSQLVDEVQESGRVVHGEIVLRRSTLDLRDLVHEAIETAHPALAERGHEVVTTLPELPLCVDGDGPRLRQVLVNLIANAAKYTPAGGEIRIAAAQEADAIVVRVRDNGIGMAPADLTQIFELFARADGVREKGFGIGLAVARELVQGHGGRIEARSDGPGRGSEFTVRLPAAAMAV